MPYAIRVHAFGGPEVMKWEEVQLDGPGPGQVKIKQYAAGVNYLDVYHRTGLTRLPQCRSHRAAKARARSWPWVKA